MQKPKYYLAIDDYENSVIIDSMNNLRNKLIADRKEGATYGVNISLGR